MVWMSLLVQGQLCMLHLYDFYLQLNLLIPKKFFYLVFSPPLQHLSTIMVSTLPTVSHSAQGHYARKLLNDLMEDYSNALRPVEDTDEALNVSLQITLSQIKDMVSRLQTHVFYQHRYEISSPEHPNVIEGQH